MPGPARSRSRGGDRPPKGKKDKKEHRSPSRARDRPKERLERQIAAPRKAKEAKTSEKHRRRESPPVAPSKARRIRPRSPAPEPAASSARPRGRSRGREAVEKDRGRSRERGRKLPGNPDKSGPYKKIHVNRAGERLYTSRGPVEACEESHSYSVEETPTGEEVEAAQ